MAVDYWQPAFYTRWITVINPAEINTNPRECLISGPHGMFFSMAMTEPSTNIQPRLPAPTPNIRSINAQQQPRQNMPWGRDLFEKIELTRSCRSNARR